MLFCLKRVFHNYNEQTFKLLRNSNLLRELLSIFCAHSECVWSSRDFLQINIPHSSKVSRMAEIRNEISLGNSSRFDLKIRGRTAVFGVKDIKLLVSKPNVEKRLCHFKSASDGSITPPGNTYELGRKFEL